MDHTQDYPAFGSLDTDAKGVYLRLIITAMTSPFNRSLRAGYGFSILILLAVSLVSYLQLRNLLASNRAAGHSSEVIQKLEQALSLMKDAETGQRGYLLSGRESYLEPYNGAYTRARQLTVELAGLTADNGRQQQNMLLIRQLFDQRLAILQKLVEKKKRGETIAAADLDAGKSAMDELRRAVTRAEKDERQLLTERTARLSRYTALVPFFFILAILTAISITIYTYRKAASDYRDKERLRLELESSEEETQALNEELTAANEEVTAANEELTAINEELMEAREALAMVNESLEQKVSERTKALQESEEETQALNEELTAMNEEMAATNEELLATNEELAESRQRLQEAFDELRLTEQHSAKLAAIVESSDDAIIGKDLDGIITSWNRGAEHVFGFPEAEILGRSVLELIPEELQHEEPLILARLRKGEKIDHYETTRRTRDGRRIQVALTISPILDKAGRVTGVSKIARDITEQKRDEQRKSDFIGMVSHELKTPLTSLSAIIQVAGAKLQHTEDTFLAGAMSKAGAQVRRMSAMINGFLNISRLESGKILIEKQAFELGGLIAEVIDETRMAVSSHRIIYVPCSPVRVFADRDKINSVLSNLISNAVKYSPKGKEVTLTCAVDQEKVTVSVADQGMGIKAHNLDKIFERYYRVETNHTQHISGFGIGLYLSAEIIERHEGRIWAESESGVGSIFYFSLPLSKE